MAYRARNQAICPRVEEDQGLRSQRIDIDAVPARFWLQGNFWYRPIVTPSLIYTISRNERLNHFCDDLV